MHAQLFKKKHGRTARKGSITYTSIFAIRNAHCRNATCHDQSKGFYQTTRCRKLTVSKADELINEGEDVLNLPTLRCKSCYTFF
ncbi:hypothetical protein HZS_7509 [Henneguya salminicola]|nr:hypothetical protein HZS_7509 [Henneguya salminicola]